VKNLRRKVEADPSAPRVVQTVLGGGYRLGLRRDK
jgi:DNA-binding response OmpR family regulator